MVTVPPLIYNFFRVVRARRTFKEYSEMSHEKLLLSVKAMLGNYNRLRNLYGEKLLEIDYLKRRNKQLETKILVLNKKK